MTVEPNSMQCSIPEALRFLASAAKTAEAHWMKAAADEIERLQKADYEFQAKVADGITDAFLERRWIPVSERLPEGEQRVLVWSQSNSLHIAYLDWQRQWRDADDNYGKKITHWMPLPSRPR